MFNNMFTTGKSKSPCKERGAYLSPEALSQLIRAEVLCDSDSAEIVSLPEDVTEESNWENY